MKNQGNKKHNNSQEIGGSLLLKETKNVKKTEALTALVLKKNLYKHGVNSWGLLYYHGL